LADAVIFTSNISEGVITLDCQEVMKYNSCASIY